MYVFIGGQFCPISGFSRRKFDLKISLHESKKNSPYGLFPGLIYQFLICHLIHFNMDFKGCYSSIWAVYHMCTIIFRIWHLNVPLDTYCITLSDFIQFVVRSYKWLRWKIPCALYCYIECTRHRLHEHLLRIYKSSFLSYTNVVGDVICFRGNVSKLWTM